MPAVTKIKEIADDPVVKELVEGKNTRLTGFLKPFTDSSEISEVFWKTFQNKLRHHRIGRLLLDTTTKVALQLKSLLSSI